MMKKTWIFFQGGQIHGIINWIEALVCTILPVELNKKTENEMLKEKYK